MASLVLSGDTSGSITVSAPAVAGSSTQTLVATTGTLAPIVSGTAVASTSGTSIDFTSIPSWVKRITVMFSGVSTSGTSNPLLQIGAGSVTTSGYLGAGMVASGATPTVSNFTSGFGYPYSAASNILQGTTVLTLVSGNTWAANGTVARSDGTSVATTAGTIALGGTLDRVRITTVSGTDTFDAGTINILYE